MIGLFSTPDLDSNCKFGDASHVERKAEEFVRPIHKDASQMTFVCDAEKFCPKPFDSATERIEI